MAAVESYCSQPKSIGALYSGSERLVEYICDTFGELPASAANGASAYVIATGKLYYWNGAWVDVSAGISAATQTALDAKAPLASPTLTGTVTVPNDSFSYAKLQDVSAASRLLGRGSAGGSGDIEEITLGAGLSMSGTALTASAGGEVFALKTSDQTAIGTAFADVTGTGLAVAANKSYAFLFLLVCDADAATTGIDVSCNGPAGFTSVNYTVSYWTSATAQAFRPFAAYDGNTASTGSNGTTRAVFLVQGVLRNGSNAGTLIARAKREAVGTGPNVRAGSYGRLTPLD